MDTIQEPHIIDTFISVYKDMDGQIQDNIFIHPDVTLDQYLLNSSYCEYCGDADDIDDKNMVDSDFILNYNSI